MNWSNEMVLEFLHYYENEPVIWNPHYKNHKRKHSVHDAWRRIKNNLSWECSIEEIKKKKDSLMAYYRIHIRKMKQSKGSEAGADDVYTTNWFAFATMDNFLKPIYESDTSFCTETVEDGNSVYLLVENNEDDSEEITQLSSSTQRTVSSPSPSTESFRRVKRKQSKRNVAKEISASKLQMTETNEHIKNKSIVPPSTPMSMNEYEIFGNLVATKIQKITNPLDREVLMNDINNLIFKAIKTSMTSQESITE